MFIVISLPSPPLNGFLVLTVSLNLAFSARIAGVARNFLACLSPGGLNQWHSLRHLRTLLPVNLTLRQRYPLGGTVYCSSEIIARTRDLPIPPCVSEHQSL